MLLTSVILVLQELLEASLILSVLLVFSVQAGISRWWAWPAIALGIGGAAIYTSQIETVSTWFDYVGVEIVNACIQYLMCLLLLAFVAFRLIDRSSIPIRLWQLLMIAIVSMAFTREGFEILLYESGFTGNAENGSSVWIGSLLGTGIGLSIGALLYYGLVSLPAVTGQRVVLVVLAMFAGNMASQGTTLMVQADWLPSGPALWNTGSWLPESSLIGKLLYALVGYEASPSALQVGSYLSLFLLMLGIGILRWPRLHT